MTKTYEEINKYCSDFFQDMLVEVKIEDSDVFIVLDSEVYKYYLSNLIYRKNSVAVGELFSGVINHLSYLYDEYKFMIVVSLD